VKGSVHKQRPIIIRQVLEYLAAVADQLEERQAAKHRFYLAERRAEANKRQYLRRAYRQLPLKHSLLRRIYRAGVMMM
jgi:hypothetical protein